VFRQCPARGQVIPDVEELEDELAGGCRVEGVALAARQGLLVLASGRLLPETESIPVEAVEGPDAARNLGYPGFEILAAFGWGAILGRIEGLGQQWFDIGRRRPAKVDAELDGVTRAWAACCGCGGAHGTSGL